MAQHAVTLKSVRLAVPGRILVDGLDLDVSPGEIVAILGPSGSGKTTVLHSIAGIVVPERGEIEITGTTLSNLRSGARAAFRLKHIGMIFQFGDLLPELRVGENVSFPLRLQGERRASAEHRAEMMLASVGLGGRGAEHPDDLSGGEVQRVGIARALVSNPAVVLADEPTGALDEKNSICVMDLLVARARELGTAVIVATHDPLVALRADRLLRLHEGHLEAVSDILEAVA